MDYQYRKYRKFYVVALVLFVVFAILNHKRIMLMYDLKITQIQLLFTLLQIFGVPIIMVLSGIHFKNVKIITNDEGIKYIIDPVNKYSINV